MATKKRDGDPPSKKEARGEFQSSPEIKTALILTGRRGIRPVQYAVVDGQAIFEGDIILGSPAAMDVQTDQLRGVMKGTVAMAAVITGDQFRWPNCRVAYDIDPALTNQNRVTDAVAQWEANTSYRFILRSAANAAQHADWITFRPSSGCSSSVGRRGGQQFINLAPGCSTGNTIHEIAHAIGLWHEQSREDRDTFVTVNWANIISGFEHNFDQHITDGDDVGAYDYASIMHYPRDAFSSNGQDTITPLDPTANIGQRNGLSPGDIAAANSLCPKITKETTKDLINDTQKEIRKDTIRDTRKELIKDLRWDTRKEIITDTRKEIIGDTRKELIKDNIKEGPLDPIKRDVPGLRPTTPGTTALPFALVTPHHAPGAQDPNPAASASELDAQLGELAEAIASAEATTALFQEQYDQTLALLQELLAADERE